MSKPVASRPAGVRVGGPEGKFGGNVATNFSSRGLAEVKPQLTLGKPEINAGARKVAIGAEKAVARSLQAPQHKGLGDVASQTDFNVNREAIPEAKSLRPLMVESEQVINLPKFEPQIPPLVESKLTDSVVAKEERARIVSEIKRAYEENPIKSETAVQRTLNPYLEAQKKSKPDVIVEPFPELPTLAVETQTMERKPTAAIMWYLKLRAREQAKENEKKPHSDIQGKKSVITLLRTSITEQVQQLQKGKPVTAVKSQLQQLRKQTEEVKTEIQTNVDTQTQVETAVLTRSLTGDLTKAERVVRNADTSGLRRTIENIRQLDELVEDDKERKENTPDIPFIQYAYVVDKDAATSRVQEGIMAAYASSRTSDPGELISGTAIAAGMESLHTIPSAISRILRFSRTRIDGSIEPTLRYLRSIRHIRKIDVQEEVERAVRYSPPVTIEEGGSGNLVTLDDVRRVVYGEEEAAKYGLVNR